MIPNQVGKNYKKALKKLGCSNINVKNITKRSPCDKKSIQKLFTDADCIFFTGGDQSRIVDIIGDTPVHDIIFNRLKNEKIVLSGTSAGAMSMSEEMIMGGSSIECLTKGSVKMRNGMGYIPSMIIDSHFVNRGRFGRLAEAVARFPQLIGVGLAEDTGLVIKNEELNYKLRDHSIFTCFAPFDKPKYSLSVVAEHMGSGSKVAAPIAKRIMELALNKY